MRGAGGGSGHPGGAGNGRIDTLSAESLDFSPTGGAPVETIGLSAISTPSTAPSLKRPAGFGLSLIAPEALASTSAGDRGRIFLAVRYGAPRAALSTDPLPVLEIPCPVLGGGPSIELWRSPSPVTVTRHGPFACAENGELMFAAAVRPLGHDLEADTLALYREMLAMVVESGYPGLIRVWNYVPDINGEQEGTERYKRFSAGRARGYEERYGIPAERNFPASSAVGTTGDALVLCLVSARKPGRHLENPRQVSAYRYPPCYGAKSPSFARGTLLPPPLGEAFFLSGTASVVGHASCHEGNLLRQLDETLRNIETLSATVGASSARVGPDLPHFSYLKTYVRRPSDFAAVRDALSSRLGPAVPRIWIGADICRAELLLEIEGVAL